MVVWAIARPCSPIIAARSRELNLKLKYQRTHRITISWSKCRPLKSSSTGTNWDICLSSQRAITFAPEPPLAARLEAGDSRTRHLFGAGPFAASQPVGLAAKAACGRGLVPHPLELRHLGFESVGPAWFAGVGGNRAALAAPIGLALEAGQTGSQRQRSRTRCQTSPHPLGGRDFATSAGAAVCR